jgi:hypothetical protein
LIVVARVLDGRLPAGRVRKEVIGHAVARERALVTLVDPIRAAAGGAQLQKSILDIDHPRFAALAGFVHQPHRAGVALAFFDHRLRQRAEEPLDVRLAHQQIDRQLHDVRLHTREALGAPTLGDLACQRRAQDLGVALEQIRARLWVVTVASLPTGGGVDVLGAVCIHASIIQQFAPGLSGLAR